MSISPEASTQGRSLFDSIAVYLRPRVLVVLFLGFSGGLPLALSGATLLYWLREVGVDLRTIGLFALVGTPYTIKFLWAPIVDALDVPILSPLLGRRRGWLLLSQLLLAAAIILLGLSDPSSAPWLVALAALLVATASATQDIIIDAFRVESLSESEQAAGMASYVAAYRIGMLASGAGALFLVSGMEGLGFGQHAAWALAYAVMAGLLVIGVATTLLATEPEKSAAANADHALHAKQNPLRRVTDAAIGAFSEFLTRDMAFVALAFVVLFKFTDAFSGVMTAPFVIDIGVSRDQYAAIVKGVGLAATLIGGFAGGFIARAYSLSTSLWIGGLLQSAANLAFSWLAVVGASTAALTFAITAENFTSAIGTVIFVAYLSALCRNPLHTATQYALLTALAAFARTYLSSTAGFVAAATGWVWFFVVCAAVGIPSLVLLAYLQRRGHFIGLDDPSHIRAKRSIGEDRIQRAYWLPMSRSFWLGIGLGVVAAAIMSLAKLMPIAMSRGLDPAHGTVLMIAVGASFVVGIVVGTLGVRFARPGATVASARGAGLGGFFLALIVLYPLLTFSFDRAVTALTVH